MPKLAMKKMAGALAPADQDGREALDKFAYGEDVLIEIKKARNVRNHRRFFKFLSETFDMQDRYDNPEIYRKAIQMGAGHFDEFVSPGGKVCYVPKSIDFENMEEIEFQKLFKQCIGVFLRDYGNGITESELMRVIEFD